jgi:two-component system sensor histidine kinase HydH
LLIGCAGLVTLFAVQAFRSARSSFYRVKAFSDKVVANMPAGLVTMDGAGRVISCNEKGVEILGFKPRMKGNESGGTLPAEILAAVDTVVQSNESLSKEVECEARDGRMLLLDLSVSPIKDDNDMVGGYLVLFKDLTEIETLKREVERNRRLASIGKLAAGVAHEIRNPLSSIKGFATYFKEKFQASPEENKIAETMVYEAERLNRAVTQLLEFARPVSVEVGEVSLEELVSHSIKLVENDLRLKHIDYDIKILSDKRLIRTDRDRMNQVLLNLYLNAIDAMESGGKLTVTVAGAAKGGHVMIRVGDTGPGIPEDNMAHIFDPYFTTKNTGTGLGLAIVYRIIEALGGAVEVESDSGKGTVFTLTIPCGKKEDGDDAQT